MSGKEPRGRARPGLGAGVDLIAGVLCLRLVLRLYPPTGSVQLVEAIVERLDDAPVGVASPAAQRAVAGQVEVAARLFPLP